MVKSLSEKIVFSLSHFQRNTKKHLQRLKRNRRPEILTVKGKAEIVVICADAFEQMQGKLSYWDTVEKLRAGIKEADDGKTIPAGKVFADMADEFSFPRKTV